MQRCILLSLFLAMVGGLAFTQAASDTHVAHPVPTTNQIDGSISPELIPDSAAYRLFFVAASFTPSATQEQKSQRRTHAAKVGLSDLDGPTFEAILSEFRSQYDDLIENYNESVEIALSRSSDPDYEGFIAQRDGLVEATRLRLQAQLTPEATSRLDELVQREKRHMKVSAQNASRASKESQ